MSIPSTLQVSDFNLEKINTDQLASHISLSFQSGDNLFVVGRRGSGKTQIAKQCILNSKLNEVYINLSLFERTDFGYPKLFGFDASSKEENFVDYLLPIMFKPLIYGNKKSVIIFDEVDKADHSILAPLLEILQFHTINGRLLPNLKCCILTANLIAEGGVRPPLPILDRTQKYLLDASDASIWLKWAATPEAHIHPIVFKFIEDHPKYLCGQTDIGDNYGSESPRSWHLASNMIHFAETANWPTERIIAKVAGFVGKRAGTEFATYYNHYERLVPLAQRIMHLDNDKESNQEFLALGPSDQFMLTMIIAARFASILDMNDPEKETPPAINRVAHFMKLAGHEHMIVSLRSQVQGERVRKWKLNRVPLWKELIKDAQTLMG